MADPQIVILNDTDVDGYHFGCATVMATIFEQLAKRNLRVTGTVKTSVDWRLDHDPLVRAADLLIINGEGTLHHGTRRGRWLLEAAQVVIAQGGKVALINALWQENPTDWTELVQDIDILACRDTRSAAVLTEATGRDDVYVLGDLSMCNQYKSAEGPRKGVIIGDSIHADITSDLARLAQSLPEAEIVPVTSTLKFVSPHLKGLRRKARSIYARWKQRRYLARNPKAHFVGSTADYIQVLRQKELSITGRFHAVCLAVATRTPFLAVDSNSWKIAALIDDIGLSTARRVSNDALSEGKIVGHDFQYTKEELHRIETTLETWRTKADALFDDIAVLIGRSNA